MKLVQKTCIGVIFMTVLAILSPFIAVVIQVLKPELKTSLSEQSKSNGESYMCTTLNVEKSMRASSDWPSLHQKE